MQSLVSHACRLAAVLAVLLGSHAGPAKAQPVDVLIQLPEPQLINAADLVDLTDFGLLSSVPGFSILLSAEPSAPNPLEVYLTISIQANLAGSPDCAVRSGLYSRHRSEPFPIGGGQRILTAFELGSGGAIELELLEEDRGLKDCIEEHVYDFATLPTGVYAITVSVFTPEAERQLGSSSEQFVISFSSGDEIQVDLFSPDNGASVPSTFPTFSWNTNAPLVTLLVFEMLPHHTTPQDAIEDPSALYLEQSLSDAFFTFTYPPSALRPLQAGNTYVWYIRAEIGSLTETIIKRSPIWQFTVETFDAGAGLDSGGQAGVLDLLDEFAGEYPELNFLGLTFESILLDEVPITAEEMRRLITRLKRDGIPLDVRQY